MAEHPTYSVGIVGARGYVGAELIDLINQHPNLELVFAASRSEAGQPVAGAPGLRSISADPEHIAKQECDAIVLAVPDGATEAYCNPQDPRVILDLSSDHRFDDSWAYGLSEANTLDISKSKRISNPGCYATALQLAARPLLDLTDAPFNAFGVSGYSGAGTTPSPRNDPQQLADGISPYKLVGHTHERECTRHLGHPVRFSPHVAPYFRGITLTLHTTLRKPTTLKTLAQHYHDAYASSPMIECLGDSMPRVQSIAQQPGAQIGGITLGPDGISLAVVCVIDNLLKGAASQAIQNLNLAFGLDMNTGILQGAHA